MSAKPWTGIEEFVFGMPYEQVRSPDPILLLRLTISQYLQETKWYGTAATGGPKTVINVDEVRN